MFVDVENNKTWTGYTNVSNKNRANVAAVKNSDGVAEIVFIHGDKIGSSANDDDYVILKGTDMEAMKDKNKKTVYKLTAAYDIHGNVRDDLYVTLSLKFFPCLPNSTYRAIMDSAHRLCDGAAGIRQAGSPLIAFCP